MALPVSYINVGLLKNDCPRQLFVFRNELGILIYRVAYYNYEKFSLHQKVNYHKFFKSGIPGTEDIIQIGVWHVKQK